MKILIGFFIFASILFGADIESFTQQEIVMIEKGILTKALIAKDYDAISSYAYSFYQTALSAKYLGDKKVLQERAIELLEICHYGNYISSSLFLVKVNLKDKPFYSRKIAFGVIKKNKTNEIVRMDPLYSNIVMLYVSSVLDHENQNADEVNFAIEAMQSLPRETVETKFYTAFLFKALANEEMANLYLDDACHAAKPTTTIFEYCFNGSLIEQEDILANKVSNPDCKADIGERCK